MHTVGTSPNGAQITGCGGGAGAGAVPSTGVGCVSQNFVREDKETIVVALGGNAILQPKQQGTCEAQYANVAETARYIAHMVLDGYRVVVTHGNGPQVGNILIQNEEGRGTVPAMPLDVCGAESQGQIGYWIQQALGNELRAAGCGQPVVTLVTQVVVDADDPAFTNPTKPVGPFYTDRRAQRLMAEKGYVMKEVGPAGWRRVVPSPEPRAIVERDAIVRLIADGAIVISCGGGGIPVRPIRPMAGLTAGGDGGAYTGVEAVIDKDLAGQRLATEVGADTFLILTDVEKVALNFGRPDQEDLDRLTVDQARGYMKEGHFRAGSMGPKVEAAVRFVEAGGRRAIITSLHKALQALRDEAGTLVVGVESGDAGRPGGYRDGPVAEKMKVNAFSCIKS